MLVILNILELILFCISLNLLKKETRFKFETLFVIIIIILNVIISILYQYLDYKIESSIMTYKIIPTILNITYIKWILVGLHNVFKFIKDIKNLKKDKMIIYIIIFIFLMIIERTIVYLYKSYQSYLLYTF